MSITKERLCIGEFCEEITAYRDDKTGFRKTFNELNDDEMFNSMREQNEAHREYERLHPIEKEESPVASTTFYKGAIQTWQEIKDDKIKLNSI